MRITLLLSFLWMLALGARGQNSVREQIDKERNGSFLDVKTYEKARSFIQRDSNYYVGYLFEGAYLFFRANDELGFNKAAIPLQKALDKIEKDYDQKVRTRTNSPKVYGENYRYQFDYCIISYFLNRCYQNVEQQVKAMDVLYHLRDRNLQVEINMESYNTIAWIIHRNRVYTSKKYPFLRNSVRENVALANRYLDSAIRKIREDLPLNNGLYDPRFINRQYLTTAHYKAMLYDYLLEVDSANYFYNLLIANHAYSSNNYAEFKLATGEMADADLFFHEAESKEVDAEKRTKEFYYMRGSLEVYRGRPNMADSLLKDVLQKQGSTPGYGWHCIGLSRAQHFEGLTAESQERANKAARFQELHIGTTWGKEQYNLAVASLNYLNQVQFKKEHWFEHNEWYFWINPVNWYRWIKYTLEIRHHKMVLASLVAGNPEREQVIYSIFASENVLTFDEVSSIIDGFGNEYFIDIYEKRLETDKRPRLKKYFRYFLGRLYLAEGKQETAKGYFEQVLDDPDRSDPYQTLLMARAWEGLANSTSGEARETAIQNLYRTYPQLMPFTDLTMSFSLQTDRNISQEDEEILGDLRNSRIEFKSNPRTPTVALSFVHQGKSLQINYTVFTHQRYLQKGTLRVDDSNRDQAGKLLAYRLFGIIKSKTGEQPPIPPPVTTDDKKKAV